jgi:hypothetical protein
MNAEEQKQLRSQTFKSADDRHRISSMAFPRSSAFHLRSSAFPS